MKFNSLSTCSLPVRFADFLDSNTIAIIVVAPVHCAETPATKLPKEVYRVAKNFYCTQASPI